MKLEEKLNTHDARRTDQITKVQTKAKDELARVEAVRAKGPQVVEDVEMKDETMAWVLHVSE